MHGEYVDYPVGDLTGEAYVAHDESVQGKRPCVLIGHAWHGQSDHERDHADRLATQGYAAIAIDVYGKGRRGTTTEENVALMQPMIADRGELKRRLLDAVAFAKAHPLVDPDRIAVIGYCFGGLCALDLARSGVPDVKGAVSIHGIFPKPELGPQGPITAKVLILHGYDDPMAKPDSMIDVATELSDAGADWQIHAYGGTLHAFTNTLANAPADGMQYSAVANRRAMRAIDDFLEEVIGG